MNMRKTIAKYAVAAALFMFPTVGSALDISVQPLLPGTITNVQLSHFDIEGSGRGAPIFRLVIDNIGDTAYSDVIVVYTIQVVSSVVDGGIQTLYKGATDPFPVAENQRYEVLSTDFLNENSVNPIHIKYRIERMKNQSFESKILAAGTVPTGLIKISMYLARGRVDNHVKLVDAGQMEAEIVNISQLDLIAPGSPAASGNDGSIAISAPFPRFSWASDLRPNMYENCDRCTDKNVFEIAIYERKPGQGTLEVLASNPLVKSKTTVPYFDYPSYSRPLVPGATYLWRVTGYLKGVIDASFVSEPYAFTVAQTIDPDVAKTQQIIMSILYSMNFGGIFESLLRDYSAGISVQSNGKVVTDEELLLLQRRFLGGELKIVNVRVE